MSTPTHTLLPFNDHTPLPWDAYGADDNTRKRKEDAEFAAHACNTYYEREAERARMVEALQLCADAGSAMRVQLNALALDYRDAMFAKGGRNELHPSHAEAMNQWDAAQDRLKEQFNINAHDPK